MSEIGTESLDASQWTLLSTEPLFWDLRLDLVLEAWRLATCDLGKCPLHSQIELED